jgi:hypothetical protein
VVEEVREEDDVEVDEPDEPLPPEVVDEGVELLLYVVNW